MDTNFIFVYGLLKSMYENEPARFIRKNCRLYGEGYFPGKLLDIGRYPGAIYDEASDYNVYGEVFEVLQNKDKLIKYLDDFEGVGSQFKQPNEYVRKVIPVHTDEQIINASVYLYNWNSKGLKVIESGRYDNVQGFR